VNPANDGFSHFPSIPLPAGSVQQADRAAGDREENGPASRKECKTPSS
jgi:hypothetical protein